MKRVMPLLIAVLFGATPIIAQDNAWKLDKAHSAVTFAIEHMAISEVTGRFKDFEIILTSSKEDFSDAQVKAAINVGSLSTDNESRDNHLKSDDFFNAAQYPTITFTSKSFEKVEGKKYKITGDLTIRDVTRTVTFDANYRGTIKTQQGTVTGWSATTAIDRFDYNLKWSRAIENVGLVAGRTVTITMNLEFKK
ncbi:MAG: YceI family protein [Bacteroidota bacterium]